MTSWKDFSRIVAEAKSAKKLDPVGQEDNDINNDGDSDSSDSYLKKRRAAVGYAISSDRKKKIEESKKLDPVGQEDNDIDNDGDVDKSDNYLRNRRKVRSKVIEGVSAVMSYKPEGDQINELSIPGTGTVMAPSGGVPYVQKKVLGLTVPFSQNVVSPNTGGVKKPNQYNPNNTEYSSAQVQRYNANKNSPSVLKPKEGNPEFGYTSVSKTPEKPVISQKPVTSQKSVTPPPDKKPTYAELGRQMRTNIDNRTQATQKAIDSLRNSYEPEGKVVDEARIDRPTKDDLEAVKGMSLSHKKRMSKNQQAIEDIKRTENPNKLSGKSQLDAMNKTFNREEFVGEAKKKQMVKVEVDPKKLGHKVVDVGPDGKEYNVKTYGSWKEKVEYIEERGMSSTEMSDILKGHKYSKQELFDMSKKSTKEGRHGEASAFYREFQKEEFKYEDLSLVDMLILEFSPLNEAPESTIPGGKSRKGMSKDVQRKQIEKLADEGDYERADRLQDVSSIKVKKNKSQTVSQEPKEQENDQSKIVNNKPKAGKSTAYERAARTTAAGRIRAARIARQIEREKREYKEKVRQEIKTERDSEKDERLKTSSEKQQQLKNDEREKRANEAGKTAEREYNVKQAKKERLKNEIGAAINVKGPDVVSSKDSDAKAIRSDIQSTGQVLGAGAKLVGVAVNKMAEKRREKNREKAGKEAREKSLKDYSQNESFFNWREGFIKEVDDQVINPDRKKNIDVSKKINKIELNPKIDEAAPLIPIIARLAGGMVGRSTGTRLAGTAAQGSLRSKAAQLAGSEVGDLATNMVKDKMERKFKNEPSSSGTGILDVLSKLGTGQNEEFVHEGSAWTKKSGKL